MFAAQQRRIRLSQGHSGAEVRWLQELAMRQGADPGPIDGIFGPRTEAALRAVGGGELPTIGRITELTLHRPFAATTSVLRGLLCLVGLSQLGVREEARNRGPEIDEYVRTTGLDPTGEHSWCAAYVVWCLETVRRWTGCPRTWIRSARVLDHAIEIDARGQKVARMYRGCLALRVGRIGGHMGIVLRAGETIEGNTDASGSREGDGVYVRQRRLDYWTLWGDWTLQGGEK
jgi:hypothetical protein